jgi:hypothetical protein
VNGNCKPGRKHSRPWCVEHDAPLLCGDRTIELADHLNKLELKRGDVAIVTGDDWAAIHDLMDNIRKTKLTVVTDEDGTFGVPIVIVPPGAKLELIDEEKMEEAGWVRKPFTR